MNKLVASSIAIALFLVVGCSPQPASFTVDDLHGIWAFMGSLIQFNEDGIFDVAGSVDEFKSRPVQFGEYSFEGTTLMFINDEESGLCAGETGIYEVEMVEDDRIEIILVEDFCSV